MMVNAGVDGFAKTLNHRILVWKRKKTAIFWKLKEYENRNIS